MKRALKMMLAISMAFALLFGAANIVPAQAASKTVKTTKITLSQTKTIKLKVGEKVTLKATVKPKNSTQKVKWSTSDEKVATVSGKGVVKAIGKGTATITAKSGSKKASVKVKVTGADLYEIVPAEPYTDEDLDYGDDSTRATWEQNHPETRPKLGGKALKLKGYTTLYLGYPIWWGMEPRIMCTFVERYNFTGITVIPFCTSGSSGIGDSGDDLARLAGTGTWLKGARHSGSISEKELRAWVEGLR